MSRKSVFTVVVCLLVIVGSQTAAVAIVQQDAQVRPIELGTSGGNINESTLRYCCSGTLGALVEDGSGQYILSNNHVLARINNGAIGEAIIQPGLIDQEPVCLEDVADSVAHLSDFVAIKFLNEGGNPMNRVDAAIAAVVPGSVDPGGSILEIGQLSVDTLKARVGLAVKKSGRTTGLTTGTVQSVNVTMDVGYSMFCGGTVTHVARFRKQLLIGPAGFSAGGDSGSVIVEDVAVNPRAVGLLFAGNSTITLANPIDDVLAALGVTMTGGAAPPPPPPPPSSPGTIAGNVSIRPGGNPIEGALVTVDGLSATTLTDSNGDYVIEDVPAGDNSVRASADGFKSQVKTTTVIEGQSVTVDFALKQQKGNRGRPNRGQIARAIAAQNRHEQRIFNIPGVVGMGVGISEGEDNPVIEVYVVDDDARLRGQIPSMLDDVDVRIVVTGAIEAF